MPFRLNRTEHYHRHEMETLAWELTVCNTLEPEQSPARRVLLYENTFGNLLVDFLAPLLPSGQTGMRVLEVGGGYGYLMRDFLQRKPGWGATMLDISPMLSGKQKETLGTFDVCFLCEDFFERDSGFFSGFDAVILNEIVGDFPTACDLPAASSADASLSSLGDLADWIRRFHLEVPSQGTFNLNLGAISALDRLCTANVPFIYLSEHSCEAQAPRELFPWLDPGSTGNPEPVPLNGHIEYTIKFSHLVQVARHHGYAVKRGPYADFLRVRHSPELRYIMTSHSVEGDHEIIRHFVQDLFKYEYLLLTRPQAFGAGVREPPHSLD